MNDEERHMPIEMSIFGALLEVREMRAGRLPEPTLEDFFAEIDTLIEQVKSGQSEEVIKMETEERYERHMPVEMSIFGSLLDIREMRAGRMPEKTWREFFAELRAEEEQEQANESHTDTAL